MIEYFKFRATASDMVLGAAIEDKLSSISKISSSFASSLRVNLNRDKIVESWMISQVKYKCISLICSLMSENVSQATKSQLYIIPADLLVK